MVSHAKIGTSTVQSRATAGVAGATFIFCLPGSPGACRDGWDDILRPSSITALGPAISSRSCRGFDEHLRWPKAKGASAAAMSIAGGTVAPGSARNSCTVPDMEIEQFGRDAPRRIAPPGLHSSSSQVSPTRS